MVCSSVSDSVVLGRNQGEHEGGDGTRNLRNILERLEDNGSGDAMVTGDKEEERRGWLGTVAEKEREGRETEEEDDGHERTRLGR